jgi:hypothetical protein
MMEKVNAGRTGRSFTTRCSEHIHDSKHNKDKPKYAKHILDHQYEYGKKMKVWNF